MARLLGQLYCGLGMYSMYMGEGGYIECVWVNVGEERGGERNGCVGEGGKGGVCVWVTGRGVSVWVTRRGEGREGECVCG